MARKKILLRRNWNKHKTDKLIELSIVKDEPDNTIDAGGLVKLASKPPNGVNRDNITDRHATNKQKDVDILDDNDKNGLSNIQDVLDYTVSNSNTNGHSSKHDEEYNFLKPAFKGNRSELKAPPAVLHDKSQYGAVVERDRGSSPLTCENTTDLKNKSNDNESNFSCFDVFIYLLSIGSFLADIGSDIFVSFLYFKDGHWAWFSLTALFIILPSIINTCFSLVWYCQDHKHYKAVGQNTSVCRWIVRYLFLFLQLGPILRYIDVLIYGCKSKRKKKDDRKSKYYEELMLNEDADAALLRLLECFMESAPQLTLQLYIMTKHGTKGTIVLQIGQSLACLTSLASLAWALTSYHRSLRLSIPDKANLTYIGMGLQFVWRFFTVGCRVVAMSLFASVYGYWIFIICFSHWFCMFVWILLLRTHFCNTKCQEFFFNIVIAIVHIFCFINVIEGHTRLRYLLYYTIVYIENAGLLFGWYIFAHTENIWYLEPALGTVLGGFFLGIFFQLIYYVFFHPNNYPPINPRKRIKLWVPLKFLCVCTAHDENMNDKTLGKVNSDGQKRILGISKHHPPHDHSAFV